MARLGVPAPAGPSPCPCWPVRPSCLRPWSPCLARRLLRSNGRPAGRGPLGQGRSIRHTQFLPGDPAPVCPECFAAARGYVGDPNDPDWAIGYRRTFYWETSSVAGDTSWWASFDDVDRDSFDDERGEGEGEGEWGDDGGEYGDDFDDDGYVDS